MDLSHLASRLIGVPLLMARPRLDAIMSVLGPRLSGGALADVSFDGLGEDDTDEAPATVPSVSLIRVYGSLVRKSYGLNALCGLTSYDSVKADIKAGLDDPNIKAIVLDIDSGGGEAGGCFDLADFIYAARQVKPIIAVSNESAFSAAYAIASSASKIYVSRTGGVGSVGVVAMHVDQSKADAAEGVAYQYIFAGDKKVDGNPHAPLSEGAASDLQSEIDRLYGIFCETVARNRGLSVDAVASTQAGLYFGPAAVSAGLADSVGTLEDALAELAAQLTAPVANPTASKQGKKLMARKKVKLEAPAPAAEDAVVETALVEDVAADATEIKVEDASDFDSGEQVVQVEDERIAVASVEGNTLIVAEDGRGIDDTAAAAHPAGSGVQVIPEGAAGADMVPTQMETPAPAIAAEIVAAAAAENLAPSDAEKSYISAVAELCQLAGVSKAEAFAYIEKGASLADVRKSLLATRAAKSEAVSLESHAPSFDERGDLNRSLGAAPWGDVLAKVEGNKQGAWGDVASRLNRS